MAIVALRGRDWTKVEVGERAEHAVVVSLSAESAAAVRFRAFFAEAEPRLRRALVAAYGPDLGGEAAADALAWAWQNFAKVETMRSPLGYLWRVGQTSVRDTTRRRHRESAWSEAVAGVESVESLFEPALVTALGELSARQRVAVVLVHGYGYKLAEVAEIQGCSVSTVRNHLERGLASLRTTLGVDDA